MLSAKFTLSVLPSESFVISVKIIFTRSNMNRIHLIYSDGVYIPNGGASYIYRLSFQTITLLRPHSFAMYNALSAAAISSSEAILS